MRLALLRDGKLVATGTEGHLWDWIHRHHCYSVGHALKYEGYKIVSAAQGPDEDGVVREERDLFATTRLVTGAAWHHGYVLDRQIGVVWACKHKHRARRGPGWTPNGLAYVSGEVFARRCADRALRALRNDDERARRIAEWERPGPGGWRW
jgi:hypothetical protein